MGQISPSRDEFASYGQGVVIYEPALILRPESVFLGDHVRIDSFTKIEGGLGVVIGRYVHVTSFCHLGIGGGLLEIGEGVGMGSGVKVLSGSNIEDGYYMSVAAPPDMYVIKRNKTVVGRGAFLGSGSIIMPGVTVGEFAIIGAGAVVTHDVPARQVWVGNPARKLRDRMDAIASAEQLSGAGFVRR